MGDLRRIDRAASEAEAQIVEACRQGDRDALGSVFEAHAPYLERLLTRIAGRDELEDLLQMTFMAAIRAFPQFRGEAQVRTWLARIAVRTAYDHLRRPERRRQQANLELVDNQEQHTHVSPERSLDDRTRLERIQHHLDHIGPKKRVAFVLHVFEGHPIDEVAALTGASLAATKSRVFWARRELLRRAHRDPALRGLFEEAPP